MPSDDRAVPKDALVWCVKHREGWCALKKNKDPKERREPDCIACRAKLAKRRGN